MRVKIYIEGGGNRRQLDSKCREGFRKLLGNCGLAQRMPSLVACGSRNETFDRFKNSPERRDANTFVALLVDSEDPIPDTEATWDHLQRRDGWNKPHGTADDQVLLMTTCMETWIVADREALSDHYGQCLQETALPTPNNLESRPRDQIQDALALATRSCSNRYAKGKRSFQILAKLSPAVLEKLPSFARMCRILEEKC